MTSSAAPFPVLAPTRRSAEVGLAVAVVFVIALLIVPLPPFLLDFFLATSIGLSLVVLLATMQTTDPLEFSSFPALLLLLTLFRLALNVSSTRLILAEGHAGQVIQAFGQFVIGGNYAVGLVLFLILVGINFIVITKGAGRVAEVAARFTLDAMPGKQMAIDADLSAGLIDETEARRRREEIARHADFYGAMDGASKFVKGDAIAALLITFINIVGGIFIAVIQRGLPLSQAASRYTVLTVGEGLVAQVPALIVSTAAGIMVTRASGATRMGDQVADQLAANPRALWIASAVLACFGLVPGLPRVPFLAFGAVLALVARQATVAEAARHRAARTADEAAQRGPEKPADPMRDLLQIDPIELEVGYALIPLVDEKQGGDLLERIQLLRKQAALEVGILIPAVRVRDDLRLPANEYVIKLRGAEIARAEVMPRFQLALDTGGVAHPIEGIETIDPAFGLTARWIATTRRVEAESVGYVVVEPTTVIATHLMEALKANSAELLGRQDVQEMVDALRKSHPALVEELIPGKVSLGLLHRVLQRLLRERLPIRDLVTILEALGDSVDQTKDAELLVEHVRRAMSNVIARLHADDAGAVRGLTMGPRLEGALMTLFSPRSAPAGTPAMTPDVLADLLRDLNLLATTHAVDGRLPPLITPPSLRIGVRRLVEPVLPALPVVSLAELPPSVKLNTVATWELTHAL
ncbi:MAG: Flagellar biosynthesis protein FlhA [Gemmatimonadaceae bacterium]|nr:Flagellar biosynthesis protein FlhA [Gemmatimonadaceae bacterium]